MISASRVLAGSARFRPTFYLPSAVNIVPGESPRIPRVALLIESSRNYGRGILRGIARYSHLHGPWSCYTGERELHSGIPDWLRHWKGHGIIARIEDRRAADALLRLRLPVIDVLGNDRFKGIPTFD